MPYLSYFGYLVISGTKSVQGPMCPATMIFNCDCIVLSTLYDRLIVSVLYEECKSVILCFTCLCFMVWSTKHSIILYCSLVNYIDCYIYRLHYGHVYYILELMFMCAGHARSFILDVFWSNTSSNDSCTSVKHAVYDYSSLYDFEYMIKDLV